MVQASGAHPSNKLDLAAVLVLFHPAANPSASLAALLNVARSCVVVDNTAEGHPWLSTRSPETDEGSSRWVVIHNRNQGGLAGAYNRALEHLRAAGAPDCVVFLDEDSDASVLSAIWTDPATQACLRDLTTAAVAPVHRDRHTGLRGMPTRIGRWRLTYLEREFIGQREVSFLINSMAIWRWLALQQIGGFDEELAVDHVDTDACLRASRLGLRLLLTGDHEFAHAIGHRRAYRLFGRTLQATGHAPLRRRQLARNTVIVGRRYARPWPAFAMLCLLRLAYECAGVVFAEEDKRRKLVAIAQGVWAGWRYQDRGATW